jgi:Predicted aminoglycoside phosphotransferase
MKDLVPREILTADLLQHPAARVWNELQTETVEPTEIQTLKRKNKSAIYRLQGAGPNGSNVIAKRCLTDTALIERFIYEQLLEALPFPTLHLYGFLDDENPEFRWLFLEDAGTNPYRSESQAHGKLLAEWLAILHTLGQQLPNANLLSARGPAHYLDHLQVGCAQIRRYIDNPALTNNDRALLEAILSQCDLLESNWKQIARFCEPMPWTFVHGDLKSKNMRVRNTGQGLALLCFDWETAGWGPPGPDLVKCPDLAHYESVARRQWQELSHDAIDRMLHVGHLFRTLAKIHWESSHLEFQWMERPRITLSACHKGLETTLHILGMN